MNLCGFLNLVNKNQRIVSTLIVFNAITRSSYYAFIVAVVYLSAIFISISITFIK